MFALFINSTATFRAGSGGTFWEIVKIASMHAVRFISLFFYFGSLTYFVSDMTIIREDQ